MPRRFRRTKIVTMLGPVTDRDNSLEKVTTAGASVVRMNFSYGSPKDHKMHVGKVREAAAKPGRHVVILGDLQGSKIHVFIFKESKVLLNIGDKFLLDTNLDKDEDDEEKAGIDHKDLSADVVPDDILLLDDDRAQSKVLEVQGMKVLTEVTAGGPLSDNKDINKLGGGLSTKVLTEKDKTDIKTVALTGVDYLTVSFPRCGGDLNYARRPTHDVGCDVKVVARAEHTEAAYSQEAVDDIILASDVVMVARGSLGTEIGDPELVGVQKALTCRVYQLNRAVATMTQVIESAITDPTPTCAEVMNVANAAPDGTDTVMLSTETVAGQYPSETVAAMACVCLGTERILSISVSKHHLDVQLDDVEEAIVMPATYAANHLKGVTVIITMTESGCTALMTSRISSGLSILTMSHHRHTLNLTALYRGVTLVYFNSVNDGVAAASEAANLLRDKGYLMFDDLVVIIQGDVMSVAGSTDTTRILAVE